MDCFAFAAVANLSENWMLSSNMALLVGVARTMAHSFSGGGSKILHALHSHESAGILEF